jgi:hypothetical protein
MEIFAKLTTDPLLEHWFFLNAIMPVLKSNHNTQETGCKALK